MTIIERIIETAELKGIKQSEIAQATGKDKSVVTNWRKRNCNPPAEYIQPIAELLGVSVSWLMTGAEEGATPLPEDERELLNNYRKLDQRDKKEVRAIINYKLEQKEPEGIVLNSKTG